MHTTTDERSPSLPYMPGLDGLRAVAVGAVFLYHVGFAWAAGGFLGVETFFVLSGYLITSLLLQDYRIYQRLRLGRFWLRRARRLWPALWLLLIGAIFLTRFAAVDAWPRLRQDLPVAFTYTTNLAYILRHVPYFQRAGRPPLLQHLWSLAVEEQFYIFWPPLLWFLLSRLRVTPRQGAKRLAAAVGALVLLSTGWMAWLYRPEADTMRLYYGTDTRAAGFLLGGMLAVLWPPLRTGKRGCGFDLAGILGLLGLVWLYYRLDEFSPWLYRGGFLLTSSASGLVVLATSGRTYLASLLGIAPLRWIGKRSYAIYLWHWPLIAVFRPGLECPWPTAWCAVVLWGASCALAEVSYRLVEQPIRRAGFRAWGRRVWQMGHGWGTAALGLAAMGAVVWALLSTAQRYAQTGPTALEIALAAEAAAAQQTPTLPPATAAPAALAPSAQTPTARPTALPSPTPAAGTPAPHSTPTPTPCPTLTPNELHLTLLGDSIMLSTLPAWQKALPPGTFFMDAAQGRRMSYLLSAIPALNKDHHLAPIAVVHLGTNGPSTDATFDAVMQLFLENGVQEVYFINVRSPIRWASLSNERLAAGAERWPQAHLLDWETYATPHRDWFYEDFAHPNPTGAKAYVQFVLQHLGWACSP